MTPTLANLLLAVAAVAPVAALAWWRPTMSGKSTVPDLTFAAAWAFTLTVPTIHDLTPWLVTALAVGWVGFTVHGTTRKVVAAATAATVGFVAAAAGSAILTATVPFTTLHPDVSTLAVRGTAAALTLLVLAGTVKVATIAARTVKIPATAPRRERVRAVAT